MPLRDSIEISDVSISEILPHRPPFIFVDRAKLLGLESLWAMKRVAENDFEFYKPDSSASPFHYPRELLVEHAAQSMMLLGHNYGRDIGWLPDGYKSIGLLTTIQDFSFDDVPIGPGDEVCTRVDVVIEKRALYYLGVKATISVGDRRVAEGLICGMFLTGQYDRLFGELAAYRAIPKEEGSHPHFSFVDRGDSTLFDSTYWFLKGHFPGSPCIPGCMFLRGVGEIVDPGKRIRRIVHAKFKKIAVPSLRFRYEVKRDGDRVGFSIRESESGEVHAKGVIELGS